MRQKGKKDMEQEALFRSQLEQLVKTARRQGMYLSEEQIRETFLELDGRDEKLALIHEYLKGLNISIGQKSDLEQFLSEEDKDFLAQYMEEIDSAGKVSGEEKREIILSAMEENETAKRRLIRLYLPDVVQIARLYTGQGAYLEDLIGEGNVALLSAVGMLGCLETPEEADGFIGKFLMNAMERFLKEEEDAKEIDDKVLGQVNEVAGAARELAKELGRNVTVEELVKETGFGEEKIREAIRVSGNQIEEIEGTWET